MSKKDDMSKAVIAICGTVLALFYAAMKFGGICVMKNSWCFGVVVLAATAFLLAVIVYCCNSSCNNVESDFCPNYSKLYKTAEEWNKAYWIDISDIGEKVPSGKKYLYVKDDVDFSKVDFETPENIEEIHFCAQALAISVEQAQRLKHAKIFLDGGKSCVEIKHSNMELEKKRNCHQWGRATV